MLDLNGPAAFALLAGLLTLGLDSGSDPTPAPAQGPAVLEAEACALCHSLSENAIAMRDSSGRGVAPYDLWRSSMMANSARDPFWRATMAAEIAATPAAREAILAECLKCHTPLGHHAGLEDHGTGSIEHALECDGRLGELARDGVSCTICHGMSPEGLGTPASFTAGYRLDPERRLFGPHAAPFTMPMRVNTGFTPTEGAHIGSSALCGSCHTFETHALDADGKSAADAPFLEQGPYLEWRNSDYVDEAGAVGSSAASCASCHLPTTDVDGVPIRARLAHNPGGRDFGMLAPRAPYGRHTLVGGNTLVLALLRDNAEELGVTAPREAFDATIAETRVLLGQRSAHVAIERVEREGGRIRFDVRIVNRAGHKLPTGYPSRRVWLRTSLKSSGGRVLFRSGAVDGAGRIVDADGVALASESAGGPVREHVDIVRSSSEVATYEALMAGTDGRPTHTLLRAASWYRDDRLLPAGWRSDHPDASRTQPVGTRADADFGPGGDVVHYDVPAGDPGELTIEVSLLYQTLSPRWESELLTVRTDAGQALAAMLAKADRTPETLATAARIVAAGKR